MLRSPWLAKGPRLLGRQTFYLSGNTENIKAFLLQLRYNQVALTDAVNIFGITSNIRLGSNVMWWDFTLLLNEETKRMYKPYFYQLLNKVYLLNKYEARGTDSSNRFSQKIRDMFMFTHRSTKLFPINSSSVRKYIQT